MRLISNLNEIVAHVIKVVVLTNNAYILALMYACQFSCQWGCFKPIQLGLLVRQVQFSMRHVCTFYLISREICFSFWEYIWIDRYPMQDYLLLLVLRVCKYLVIIGRVSNFYLKILLGLSSYDFNVLDIVRSITLHHPLLVWEFL